MGGGLHGRLIITHDGTVKEGEIQTSPVHAGFQK